MIRIRAKIVIALLVVTLLPVAPLYLLLQGFLEQSLEIGFNSRVDAALGHAAEFSRNLYARYKQEALAAAKELTLAANAKDLLSRRNTEDERRALSDVAKRLGVDGIELYDSEGRLRLSGMPDSGKIPSSLGSGVAAVKESNTPGLLDVGELPSRVIAFAPVFSAGRRVGTLVVSKDLDDQFVRHSRDVVEVHQIFKTLGWVSGDLKQSFMIAFFVFYAPFAVLSIVVGYLLSRRITAPLSSLVEGTRRVAEGDWGHRIKVTSRDEVGQLVAAFNRMVGALKEKQDQLVALEKTAVWSEIARVLAHEIKNPLTPIQLTVQQLKDKYQGKDVEYRQLLHECTEIISDEIDTLRSLVREFSDFARLPQLNPVPVDLNEVVTDVSRLYSDSSLHLDLDPRLPVTLLDQENIRRVLINLIDNALDSVASKEEAEILIRTFQQETHLILQVSDTGGGIPPDLREKVFEPHFSTKKSGMGLGLAIVKRIVEEHGGTIGLESDAASTTFTIQLGLQRVS